MKMTPLQATDPNNVNLVLFDTHENNKFDVRKPKCAVGDRVRIYSYKNKFDKGSKNKWTREIFIITDNNHTSPITYKLKDLNGKVIIGSF